MAPESNWLTMPYKLCRGCIDIVFIGILSTTPRAISVQEHDLDAWLRSMIWAHDSESEALET